MKHGRFFVLLGFADGDDPAFQPNYDIPFEALVRNYVWAFIDKGSVMEILYHADLNLNTIEHPTTNFPLGYLTGPLQRGYALPLVKERSEMSCFWPSEALCFSDCL